MHGWRTGGRSRGTLAARWNSRRSTPAYYSFTSIAGTAHCVAGEYDKATYCRLSLRHNHLYTSTQSAFSTIALAIGRPGRQAKRGGQTCGAEAD